MKTKPGQIATDIEHWHLLLEYCSDHNLLEVMWRAIDAMEDLGCRPTNATIKLLLHAIFRSSSRHLSQVLALIDRVGRLSLPFDETVLALIMEKFTGQGSIVKAVKAGGTYRSN